MGNTQGIVDRSRPFCSLCYLHNTDIESLIYSIYEISVNNRHLAPVCPDVWDKSIRKLSKVTQKVATAVFT